MRALPGRGDPAVARGGRHRCDPRPRLPRLPGRSLRVRQGARDRMTANFFSGNADLVEVFDRVIPWSRVVRAVEGEGSDAAETVSTWREIMDAAGRYIGSEIAPRAQRIDELGVIRDNGHVRMNEPMTEGLKGLAAMGLASP